MKVIDLLNKIANGEIKNETRFYLGLNKSQYWYIEKGRLYNQNDLEHYFLLNELNDEIEIIEEDSPIKKLEPVRGSDLTDLIRDEIKNMVESKKTEVSEMIKKELSKKVNINKFVDSFIDSTTKKIDNTWLTKINIEFDKNEDNY